MELLDVIDSNNKLTGEIKSRKEIHENGIWHRHGSCWIMNMQGEILLQKRSMNKKRNPGVWSKTGGHIESGETVEVGLIREIEEEIGLHVREQELELLDINSSDCGKNKHFTYDYFIITNKILSEYILQKEEVEDVKYISVECIEEEVKRGNTKYTFTNWERESFNRKIEILKEKREIILKANYIK